MHPRFLTQRNEAAQAAIEKAAQAFAASLGLPDEALAPLRVTDRDPEVQAMLRREAVADLLNHVALLGISMASDATSATAYRALPITSREADSLSTIEEALRERLLTIHGVGPAVAQKILEALAEELSLHVGEEEGEGEEPSGEEEGEGDSSLATGATS